MHKLQIGTLLPDLSGRHSPPPPDLQLFQVHYCVYFVFVCFINPLGQVNGVLYCSELGIVLSACTVLNVWKVHSNKFKTCCPFSLKIVFYIMFHCFNNPCERLLLKVSVALADLAEKLNS